MAFSRIQILFTLLLFSGISNHVLIIPHLLDISKREAWLCVLFSYVILLIWGRIYTFIFSKNKDRQPLESWLRMCIGKYATQFILFLFFIFIFISGFIAFYDLIVSVKIYFLPMTSTGFLVIPFLILCTWAALKGFKTIVYSSAFILPIVWGLGIFVALATMEAKDYSFLFPVFADDISYLHGMVIVLAGSVDMIILFLIQQYFNKPISYVYIFVFVSLLMGLILGPTMGTISAFGPSIASDLRFPAFEQWRLVEIGEHISHVDSLAVIQLLSGAVIRVSLCLYLLPYTINLQTKNKKFFFPIVISGIYALMMFTHISDIWMQTALRNYIYPFIFLLGFSITFILLAVSYLPKKEKGPIDL